MILNNMSDKYDYIKIFFDGGSRGNPGPSAVGYVIYDSNENKLEAEGKYIGKKTNNMAEYLALDNSLDSAAKYDADSIMIFTDSKLVASQIKREWKVKDKNILEIYKRINKKLSVYKVVDMRHIPREKNREADKLVNQALDKHSPSYEGEIDINFGTIED